MQVNMISFILCMSVVFHASFVVAKEHRTITKCFDTLLHYYSNPKVTGKSEIEYTFRNNIFHDIDILISCKTDGISSGLIEIESVDLLLPANENEFCLEEQRTDHTECTSKSQCVCCEVPNATCNKTLHQRYEFCNNQTECEIKITSEFLYNCSGRTFTCDDTNCHSRWAQVIYRCKPAVHLIVSTISPRGVESEESNRLAHYLGVALAVVSFLLLMFIFVITCWYMKKKQILFGDKRQIQKTQLSKCKEKAIEPQQRGEVIEEELSLIPSSHQDYDRTTKDMLLQINNRLKNLEATVAEKSSQCTVATCHQETDTRQQEILKASHEYNKEKIKRTLINDVPKMMPHQNPVHMTVLWNWIEPLTEYMKLFDVVIYIFNANSITQREKEEVLLKMTQEDSTGAARHLLTNVLLRNPDYESFRVFVMALRETKDTVLADNLEHDYKELASQIEAAQKEFHQSGSNLPQSMVQGFVKAYKEFVLKDYDLSTLQVKEIVPTISMDKLHIATGRLGRGSFSFVFPGTFKGKDVAVKEISLNVGRQKGKMLIEQYQHHLVDRDFQSNFDVAHNHIIQLMAYTLDKDSLYLVLEYVDGQSWEKIIFDPEIHQEYDMSTQDKFYLSAQICQGVAYLHQCLPSLIHRDIKPSNMMVNRQKTCAKLANLGMNKLKMSNAMDTSNRYNPTGSSLYMAPESLIDGKASTTHSDTWSLAASLYEIFFEKEVWEDEDISYIKSKLSNKCHPEHVDKPQPGNENIAGLIKKYMAYDDQQRQSSLNLLKDLQNLERDFLNTNNSPQPTLDMAVAAGTL